MEKVEKEEKEEEEAEEKEEEEAEEVEEADEPMDENKEESANEEDDDEVPEMLPNPSVAELGEGQVNIKFDTPLSNKSKAMDSTMSSTFLNATQIRGHKVTMTYQNPYDDEKEAVCTGCKMQIPVQYGFYHGDNADFC